jgi:8-oxo-dGTP pyrophosphatase MutT (NUDIX family)
MAEAPARLSASIILVRDSAAGMQTFMVRRHERSHVAPNAYVFPGGTVRADDTLGEASDVSVAALRELFEEAGVLLAYERGHLLEVRDDDVQRQEHLASARLALQAHELSLRQLLDDHHWQPAFDRLIAFSHWVTPSVVAVRFDTRFFVAEMPPRQEALHCTIETSEGVWLTPGQLLNGQFDLVFPTVQHLKRLAPFGSVAALLDFARNKSIQRVQPTMVETPTGVRAEIPGAIRDDW